MHKKIHYKFLIIGLLFISLIASNINSAEMNLLGIDLSFNFGIFRTTVTYIFLCIAIFITVIFILTQKFINKKIIITLLIFYIFYHIVSLAISFLKNHDITMWVITLPFYPLFSLLFLVKNWDFNLNTVYLLNKIKLFLYIAILIGVVALIARRDCQFLDLLSISLLFLSFELLIKKNVKAFFPIIGLALVSGFNLTWLFTFLFLVVIATVYYIKHLKIHKIVFIFIIAVLIFYIISSALFFSLNLDDKFPLKERFTQKALLHATGRTALWKKYIYQYDGNFFELLFGRGSAFVYTVSYEKQTFRVGHLHNIFFDEFSKRGIIGLLFLLSIIIVSLKTRAPNYLKVFLILLLVEGQSNLNIFDGVAGIIFWMVVGMLNNTPKINKFTINSKHQKIIKTTSKYLILDEQQFYREKL